MRALAIFVLCALPCVAQAQTITASPGAAGTLLSHTTVAPKVAPAATNATLDSGASDMAGTLILTAANPVLTFASAFSSAPHCSLASPSGSQFTAVISSTAITFSGGTTGSIITYSGCTQ
jgi:hypothetical protein